MNIYFTSKIMLGAFSCFNIKANSRNSPQYTAAASLFTEKKKTVIRIQPTNDLSKKQVAQSDKELPETQNIN